MATRRAGGCAILLILGFGLLVNVVAAFTIWEKLFPDAIPLWMTSRRWHSYFIAGGDLELQPGQTERPVPMAAGEFEWPGWPVVSINRWSVEPAAGVEVNRWTGRVRVLPDAKHGSRHTIRGKLGLRGIPVETELIVYRRDSNPLVGSWASEQVRDGIVHFRADGRFVVTLRPQIEDMVDYGGTYRFDLRTGAIEMTTAEAPPDADLRGTFRIEHDGHRLILKDIYLGTYEGRPRVTEETFRR